MFERNGKKRKKEKTKSIQKSAWKTVDSLKEEW